VTLTLRPIAHSEIGLVRKTNQDSGYLSTSTLIVADGMGGAAAGDLASGMAIRTLCHVNDTPVSGEEALDALKEYVYKANEDIAELIETNPNLDGMGTTICGGIFDGEQMNIVHIGDSRGYLLSDGVLTRLTHDHSYVQSLIDEGRLGENEAMNHPHRSLLLRVLNGQPEIKPDFFSAEVSQGDRLMFCSDGLCGLVGDSIIGTVMRLPDPDEVMTTLIELAHVAGGTDNITIILADVVEAGESDDEPGPDTASFADEESDQEHTLLMSDTLQEALPVEGYPNSGLIGAAADPRVISLLGALREEPLAEPGLQPVPPTTPKLTSAQQERRRYTPSAKKSHKGFLLIALAIIVALGGAGWGVYTYVSSQYFVGELDGHVAIFQGIPGDIAGIDTFRVYESTTIALRDLPTSWRDKVTATISTSGLDQAHASVAELKTKAQQCLTERATRPPGSKPAADGC